MARHEALSCGAVRGYSIPRTVARILHHLLTTDGARLARVATRGGWSSCMRTAADTFGIRELRILEVAGGKPPDPVEVPPCPASPSTPPSRRARGNCPPAISTPAESCPLRDRRRCVPRTATAFRCLLPMTAPSPLRAAARLMSCMMLAKRTPFSPAMPHWAILSVRIANFVINRRSTSAVSRPREILGPPQRHVAIADP